MLTPKQQLFVDYYLQHLNATKAAIEAGYSVKTASSIGHENLTKPEIKKHIQDRLQTNELTNVNLTNKIIAETASLAFDNSGEVKPSEKLKALELLGRRFDTFSPRKEQDNHASDIVGARVLELAAKMKQDGGL